MLPHFRTGKYLIYKACERFKILPPGIKESWDKCHAIAKANLIGYEQIRSEEERAKGDS